MLFTISFKRHKQLKRALWFNNNNFFIYDYEQRDYREINNEKWAEITSLVGKIPYQELRKLKDEYIKIRKFGIHGAKKINS